MLKINELLEKTSKTVGSVAGITVGLAVATTAAVCVRSSLRELLGLNKTKISVTTKKVAKKVSKEEKDNTESTAKK